MSEMDRNAQTARNLVIEREVARIDEALCAVRHAFLKGIVLARALYENIGDRPMIDIDVLVDRVQLDEALEALRNLGYQPLPQFRMLDHPDLAYEAPLSREIASGLELVVDLHWSLFKPSVFNTTHLPWVTAETIELAGRSIPTLDPSLTTLHLAIHDVQHGCQVPHIATDLRRAIGVYGSDLEWDRIARLATRLGAHHVVAFALEHRRLPHQVPVTRRAHVVRRVFEFWESRSGRDYEPRRKVALAFLLTPRNLLRYGRELVAPPRFVVGTVLGIPTEAVRVRHYVRRLVRKDRALPTAGVK